MFLHRSVILSLGGCIPACTGADTPLGRHFPHADTPLGRCPLGRHPLGRPPGQTPPHLENTPPADSYCSGRYIFYWNAFFLIIIARKRSLGQGNIFTCVCHRGMCGCWGACVVVGGACIVAIGVCMVVGGHAWLPGGYLGYDEIRSMSGRYASYWNAFLLFFADTHHSQTFNKRL